MIVRKDMSCRVSVKQQFLMLALLMSATHVHAESVAGSSLTEQAMKTSSGLTSNLAEFQYQDEYLRRQQRMRDMAFIPPPPPGPYLSSALKPSTVKAQSAARHTNFNRNRKVMDVTDWVFDSSSTAMDRFSPDRPWPDDWQPSNRPLPSHWMSGDVPHHAKPRAHDRVGSASHNRMPFMSHYDYRMPRNMPLHNMPSHNMPPHSMPPIHPNNMMQSWPSQAYEPAMQQPVFQQMPSMGRYMREPFMHNNEMR